MVRRGQQEGRGVESVAGEYLSRENSSTNLSVMGTTNAATPVGVEKAPSAQEMKTDKAFVEDDASAPATVAKGEDIRATKSTEGLKKEHKDSGYESQQSLEQKAAFAAFRASGKASVASSKYSQPEAAVTVGATSKEGEQEEEKIMVAAAGA